MNCSRSGTCKILGTLRNHLGNTNESVAWKYKFALFVQLRDYSNSPFPSCCEPHYESEAKCKTFHMKISFVCIWMKTNFHNKNFALSLAFIMRFKATRKWSISSTRIMWQNYPVTQQVGTAFKLRETMKNSLSGAHVLHKTLNLVISPKFITQVRGLCFSN